MGFEWFLRSRIFQLVSSTNVLVRRTEVSPNFSHFCICGAHRCGLVLWYGLEMAGNCLTNGQLTRFCVVIIAFRMQDNQETERARTFPSQRPSRF